MTADHSNVILRALADTRRRQILAIKLNPATAAMYSDAFVYAVLHRLYPAYDEEVPFKGAGLETDQLFRDFPYHDTYDVPRSQVEAIADLLDEKWLAREPITYYQVEGEYRFGPKRWRGPDHRTGLITTSRYLFLKGMFDAEFWSHYTSDAPCEAYDITSAWDPKELLTWAHL